MPEANENKIYLNCLVGQNILLDDKNSQPSYRPDFAGYRKSILKGSEQNINQAHETEDRTVVGRK